MFETEGEGEGEGVREREREREREGMKSSVEHTLRPDDS